MVIESPLNKDSSALDETYEVGPKFFLGSYMPFAGVKCYAILDEEEIHKGRNRIGDVGWRAARTSAVTVARAAVTSPVLDSHIMKQVDIFRGLTEEQIDRVVSLGQRIRVPEGEVLGTAGEFVNHLFIIIEGRAELSAHSAIGEITVRIAGPGESFPLAVLIGSGTLITSASAMTDMKLLAIARSRLLALCSEDTAIGMWIYAAVADVLAIRYTDTLAHLTASAQRALRQAGFFANV